MEKHPIPLALARLDRFVMPLMLPTEKGRYETPPSKFQSPIEATSWDMRRHVFFNLLNVAANPTPPSIEEVERTWVHCDQYLALIDACLTEGCTPEWPLMWCSSPSSLRARVPALVHERVLIVYNMVVLGFDLALRQLHQGVDTAPIVLSRQRTDLPPEYKVTRLRLIRKLIYDQFIVKPDVAMRALQQANLVPSDMTWRCFYDYTSLLILEWTTIRCHLQTPTVDYMMHHILRLTTTTASVDWDDDEKVVLLATKLAKAAAIAEMLCRRLITIQKDNNTATSRLVLSPDHAGLTLHIVKYCTQAHALLMTLQYGMRAALALARNQLGETVYWNNLFKEKIKGPIFVGLETKKYPTASSGNNNKSTSLVQMMVPPELLTLDLKSNLWSMQLRGEMQPSLVDHIVQCCRAIFRHLNQTTGISTLLEQSQPLPPHDAPEELNLAIRMDHPLIDDGTLPLMLPSSDAIQWCQSAPNISVKNNNTIDSLI